MLIKASGVLENSVAKFDPEIPVLEVAQSFSRHYLKRNSNWRSALDNNLVSFLFADKATGKMSERINELTDAFVSGDAKVDPQYKGE